MRKGELKLDTDYVVKGDRRTPHRLISLKDPENPYRVVTRVDGAHVSIHPSKLVARWDDPEEVKAREREQARERRHREAIDLAERLGFKVARDGDGWEAHQQAEARWALGHYRAGRDILLGCLEIELDAWLRVAPRLAEALPHHPDRRAPSRQVG